MTSPPTSTALLRKYVGTINGAAIRLGSAAIHHASGFEKANKLFQSLKDRMEPSELAAAQSAQSAYEQAMKTPASSASASAAGESDQRERRSYHLRGFGFMLTYNDKFRKWRERHIEAVFERFVAFIKGLMVLGVVLWSATAERSLKSEDGGRIHMHAYIEFPKPGIDLEAGQRFEFDGVRPRFDNNWYNQGQIENQAGTTLKKANATKQSLAEGHFYVFMNKIGTIFSRSNTLPYINYWPRLEKIDDWKKQGYYTDEQYLEYAAKYTIGFNQRYNDVKAKRKYEEELAENERKEMQKKRKELLDSKKKPMRSYAEIDEWKKQYDHIDFRYHFLVLHGPSRTGKTELARSLYNNAYVHKGSIDWSKYDSRVHDVIIFDDVPNIYAYVDDNRALFQAGPDGIVVNTSATNAFAHTIYLAGKPMIITSNDVPPADNEWIAANARVVFIDSQTWIDSE